MVISGLRHSPGPGWGSLAVVAILTLGLMTDGALSASADPAPVESNTNVTQGQKQPLLDIQSNIEDIAQKLDPAVVHIEAEIVPANGGQNQPEQVLPFGPDVPGFPGFPNPRGNPQAPVRPGLASGSGIIIDPNGTIITNRHLIEGAKRVTVTLTDHRSLSGTVYSDPNIDLAVVKIQGTGFPYARLADSSHLRIGQFVLAIGYPFDVGQTVSLGIVSALGRSQTIEGRFYPNLIQTDASINPGNSGGALVDLNGDVVGINTAIAGEAAQSAGIGFAIPSSTVSIVLPQLAESPHKITKYPPGWVRGKLGVEVRAVVPDLFKMLGVDQGALVVEVQPDGAAARAGVQAGDVITKVNELPVRDANELVDDISDVGPGQKAVLSIVRDKKPMTRTVITGSFATETANAAGTSDKHLGLSVETLSPDMRQQLKLPNTVRDGAVVTGVQVGSPAEAAGFLQGDVIYQVNDTPIHSADDYNASIATTKAGDSIGVKVYRGATSAFLVLQVPDNQQ